MLRTERYVIHVYQNSGRILSGMSICSNTIYWGSEDRIKTHTWNLFRAEEMGYLEISGMFGMHLLTVQWLW